MPHNDRAGSVFLERRVGVGIAFLVPAFAVIALVAMMSDEGARSATAITIGALTCLSTIPVGAWWWFRSADKARMPGWFVLYADVGVTITLLTFSSSDLALFGTTLFAVVGTYIAYFTRRRILRLHTVFVNVVIVVLTVMAFVDGTHDAASNIARMLVSMLVVNSVVAFRNVIKGQLDLANTDSLTGLLNRRGFELRLERTLARTARGWYVALLVVDLDRFKLINDTHGHSVGDTVLELVARRLGTWTTVSALHEAYAARSGGEEFIVAVVLDTPDTADVLDRAERIRTLLHDQDDAHPVTVSVGASVLAAGDSRKQNSVSALRRSIRAALMAADSAMYDAKRAGGNRSAVAHEPAADRPSPPDSDRSAAGGD